MLFGRRYPCRRLQIWDIVDIVEEDELVRLVGVEVGSARVLIEFLQLAEGVYKRLVLHFIGVLLFLVLGLSVVVLIVLAVSLQDNLLLLLFNSYISLFTVQALVLLL